MRDVILMLGADPPQRLLGGRCPTSSWSRFHGRTTGVRTSHLRGISFTANKFAPKPSLTRSPVRNGNSTRSNFRLQNSGQVTSAAIAVVEASPASGENWEWTCGSGRARTWIGMALSTIQGVAGRRGL